MSYQTLTNTFIFLSIIILLYIGHQIGANKVGFSCSDESIKMPHLPQSIDFRLLLFTIFTVPSLIFFIVDRSDIKYYLRNYNYGIGINILLTQYCKLIIGRPRPNFHSICKPDVQCGINDTFITDFTCTNDNKWLTSNAIQSFFSGHSSLGTYSSFFVIFYIHDKLRVNGLLKAHLLFMLFMIGLLPGLTQYLRHWHFASDVFTGDIVGILLALFTYYGIKKLDNIKHSNLGLKNSKTNN